MIASYYAVSMAGPSHIDRGEPCQDSYHVVKKGKAIFAAVADGVGSQKFSDYGSAIAAEDSVEYCAEGYGDNMGDDEVCLLMKQAFKVAYFNILKFAADNGVSNGEGYDTTLCLAIYNGEKLFYGQAGDSGLVVLPGNGEYRAVTRQQRGNDGGVYPLCAGPGVWEFGVINEPVYSLLLCTDGVLEQLEPTVLEGGLNIALCEKLMHPHKEWSPEDYEKGVYGFFEGYPRDYLDDDKTAVLIVNTAVEPERKVDEYYLPPDWNVAYAKAQSKRAGAPVDEEPELTEESEEHVVPEPVEESEEELKPVGCTDSDAPAAVRNRKKSLPIIAATVGLGAVIFVSSAAFVLSCMSIGRTQPTYLGLFKAVVTANASILLPVPTFRLIMDMSHILSPMVVAVVAAFASTVAEVFAYIAGECASKLMRHRLRLKLKLDFTYTIFYPNLTAFILGCAPLPLFDLYMLWAGVAGADEAKLATAAFLGRLCKMLFYVIIASFISPLI